MKRILPLLFYISFAAAALAQQAVIKTTFEGREVNIYPYRVEASDNSSDNYYLQTREYLDIPYCPLMLPDGEYVAFYPKIVHYNKMRQVIYLKGDTDDVAVVFSIKDHKKEGAATWYTNGIKNKKVYQTGNYVNDLKDGNWTFTSRYRSMTYAYSQSLLNGDVQIHSHATHHNVSYHLTNGVLNGVYSIENTKNNDKTMLSYVDGKITGSYYTLKHKATLNDISVFGGYTSNSKKYKQIEVNGNLNESLKYGTWEIKLNDSKFVLEIDTLNTSNIGHGYGDDYGNNRDPFELFHINLLRTQRMGSSNELYHSPNYNNEFWNWNFFTLLSFSYGKFTEYDKYGKILNTDSFFDQQLKAPYILKDSKGVSRIAFSKVEGTDSLYRLVNTGLRNQEVRNYVRKNTKLETLETIKTDHTNKNEIEINYQRELAYHKTFAPADTKRILTDSTIYLDTKKNDTFISVEYLHLPSGYKYGGYYFNNKLTLRNTIEFDSANRWVKIVTSKRIGSLTITDTSIIRIGKPFNLNTYINNAYTNVNDLKNPRKKVFDDTLRLGVFWENKPLTGNLFIYLNRKYEKEIAKEATRKNGFVFNDYKDIEATIWYYHFENICNISNAERQINNLVLSVENGQLKGPQQVVTRLYKSKDKHVMMEETMFSENLKNGYEHRIHHTYTYKQKHFRLLREFLSILRLGRRTHHSYRGKPNKAFKTYTETTYYLNGKIQGLYMPKDYQGNANFIMHLNDGNLQGEFVKLNSNEQPFIKCHFLNDTLHGTYEDFNSNNEVTNTATFKNGLLHGLYHQYQYLNQNVKTNAELLDKSITYCASRKVNTIALEFDNGYLVNTGKYYHCDGILKAEIKYDINDSIDLLQFAHGNGSKYYIYRNPYYASETYQGRKVRSGQFSEPFCYINYLENQTFVGKFSLDFYSFLPGYYKYYYKSGVQSQEGRINQKGIKTGWWKFWNENGILMKEIAYEKGYLIDPVTGNDTIKYTGRIKGYYPNGKFMMEGYVLDEDLKYECVQDEEIAYQQVFYTRFADESGVENFKNHTGMVRDYHINGNKRQEGALLNTKRNGVWRTYESNGNLHSIGNYKNGLKEGLWLTGDLSGIGFVDNECFDGIIDINKIKGNLNERKLEFEELFYKDGQVLKSTIHNVELK